MLTNGLRKGGIAVRKFPSTLGIGKVVIPVLVSSLLVFGIIGLVGAFSSADDSASGVVYSELDEIEKTNSITWDLNGDKCMYTGDYTGVGPVTIAAGDSYTWVADEQCQADLTFPAVQPNGGGEGWLLVLNMTSAGSYTMEIGICTEAMGGGWASKQTMTIVEGLSVGNQHVSVLSTDEFVVGDGEYLAFRMTNTSLGDSMTIETDEGQSWLTWPYTDNPPYPIPELSTIVLMGTGLLAVGGYVGWRRHRIIAGANNKVR